MSVELVWITPNAEELIARIARVSNPENADNPSYVKLLKYLIDHKHWSPYEMANMCLSIHTSRRIAPQILRHKMSFQEFSTRYAVVDGFVDVAPRSQDLKNRQSSHDNLSDQDKDWFQEYKLSLESAAKRFYALGLQKGFAKETMAFVLPMSAKTHLYCNTTIRNWIHYIQLRTEPATQLEHRQIATAAKQIFIEHLPNIAAALGWQD